MSQELGESVKYCDTGDITILDLLEAGLDIDANANVSASAYVCAYGNVKANECGNCSRV
jgi:hypothetical protein